VSADPARRAAADVVLAVDRDAVFANLLLPRLLRERHIAGTDAAFATELAYGTLRWQGSLDAVIEVGARRAVSTLDAPVRAVLRLGAYQLLHTRVPPHAAVSTTVDLGRAVAGPKPAGFINAVMRRVSEQPWDRWVDTLTQSEDELGRLGFSLGYPRWIAEGLLEALDGDLTQLRDLLAVDRPSTHLLARPGMIEASALAEAAGAGATVGELSPYAVRLHGGDPSRLTAMRDGRARVQDEGSQLVALATARAELIGDRDARWLDMCAGPGGKSSLLAGLLPIDGRLLSADLQLHRAGLVSRGVAGTATTVVVADGTRPAWRPGSFDRVLADVPCSGLGSLRRRPDVRWRRQPQDVELLGPLQRGLLNSAIDATRPGGIAVYATCSPLVSETTAVVSDVLDRRTDAVVVDAREFLPSVPDLGEGPFVRLWPHLHGTDAMFIAVLQRISTDSAAAPSVST
jgi:16S rRNA (cytosine967-C5)-methyltransferase